MQDDKVGNKTAYEEERLLRMREKTKKLFNYVRSVGNYAFFLQNSFLAILMLISRKLVLRKRIGDKCGFFATRRPSPN